MELKNVQQTKVFGKEIKTSLKSIWNHVQVLPEEVMNEMQDKKITANGPQIWIYKGADGNPETVFDLMVSFPVTHNEVKPEISSLPELKCATIIHKGDWKKLGESYNLIMGEIMRDGLQMNGECREVYHTVDFENVENNLTEIQIGIR